jgi:hypothetical protein
MVILSMAFFAFLLEVLVATRVLRMTLMHAASFRATQEDSTTADEP